jgi:acyl carrier protein
MLAWASKALSAVPPAPRNGHRGSNGQPAVLFQQANRDRGSRRVVPPNVTWPETHAVLLSQLCERQATTPQKLNQPSSWADLGVDTVKQAEIMAAVREHYGLAKDESFRLADYPTLQDLAEYLVQRLVLSGQAQSPSANAETAEPVSDGQPAVVVQRPGVVWRDTYTVLLAQLCEKTGYDAGEIEPAFELEADLGVDTVKQAEIMAAVREHYGLAKDETFRLADYPTLQDLAEYLVERLVMSGQAQSESAAAETAVLPPVVSQDRSQEVGWQDTYAVLLNQLCERTGYDAAEIEPAFELEADLGVDTVKQAEIMAAVREHFSLAKDESFRLADYPTLEDLARYLVQRLVASGSPVSEPPREAEAPQPAASHLPTPVSHSPNQATWEDTYAVLLGQLCEKTGYDGGEIEPAFELEADLGVDTVKQAEIMAAVREHYGLPKDETFRLADHPAEGSGCLPGRAPVLCRCGHCPRERHRCGAALIADGQFAVAERPAPAQ